MEVHLSALRKIIYLIFGQKNQDLWEIISIMFTWVVTAGSQHDSKTFNSEFVR